MRILMFGWEFPPHNSGGLGNACYGLSQALVQQGIEIVFVLPKKLKLGSHFVKLIFADDQFNFNRRRGDFPVTVVNSSLSPYISSRQYTAGRISEAGMYGDSLIGEVYRYGLAARKIAQTTKFDLIHAHDWLSFRAGLQAKRVSQKPLVVHVHATEYDRSGGNLPPEPRKSSTSSSLSDLGVEDLRLRPEGARPCDEVVRIELEGLQEADRIIAVSNYTKRILTRFYKIPADKIDVVHNGVSLARPGLAEKVTFLEKLKKKACYKIVLFVGRITLQKGPDWFVRAADKVLQYNRQVLFIIAGAGDMQPQIVQQTADLGISDKVLFAGFLRGAELESAYQAADLFVMPSVSEPFGLTSLESLASGTPILISKQSGAAEILPHALKVDFWDVDEMANKILAVLDFPALRQTLKENGRQTVRQFNWKHSAERCVRVYKSLLASQGQALRG